MPGFVDGYGRIAADEQRHIAYGTWFLREAVAADPAMADVIREQIKRAAAGGGRDDLAAQRGRLDALGCRATGALAEFGLGRAQSAARR